MHRAEQPYSLPNLVEMDQKALGVLIADLEILERLSVHPHIFVGAEAYLESCAKNDGYVARLNLETYRRLMKKYPWFVPSQILTSFSEHDPRRSTPVLDQAQAELQRKNVRHMEWLSHR